MNRIYINDIIVSGTHGKTAIRTAIIVKTIDLSYDFMNKK
jgi:hypothetical protein